VPEPGTTTPADFVAERQIRIQASPETVFSFFTEPDKLLKWMGTEAELDPRPGGIYRHQVRPDSLMIGEFVDLRPPRFLSFTWGWAGPDSPVPPGSSLVEVTLDSDGDGTVLTLRHSGLPSPESVNLHDGGWQHFLERLSITAAGGDPGPDPWAGGGDQ
jgi:uncharacterized protein YndB with AHSA1/START domain